MAVSTVQEDKKKALGLAIAQIEKSCGKGAIMKMGSTDRVRVESISTGAINLDAAIGVGGIPRGRVTEIYGPESSGKTTLCLHVVANAQKAGGTAAYIDAAPIAPLCLPELSEQPRDLRGWYSRPCV
jgi:recombination protein RecA